MIKKQTRLIVAAIIALVAIAVLYFAVIRPLVNRTDPVETPNLLDGEALGTDNRIFMMPEIPESSVARIEVHNGMGGFTFYRATDGKIYLEGYEESPYSADAYNAVATAARYTLSIRRVTEKCEDFSEYGLSEADDPMYYIITDIMGTHHKIYVGDALITGGGYYCRYDGRDAVYVLDNTIGYLNYALTSFITPVLTQVNANNFLDVTDFYIIRDGKMFVNIDRMSDSEFAASGLASRFKFAYPAGYAVNVDAYSLIMQTVAALGGDHTVEAAKTGSTLSKEHLKEAYGIDIDSPKYVIHFKYDGVDQYAIFSAPDDDGYMYAYSVNYNHVVLIAKSECTFLDYTLLEMIDKPLFAIDINNISKIEIKGDGVDARFTVTGSGTDLGVWIDTTGRSLDAEGVKNFRRLYRGLLGINLQDYTDNRDTTNELAELKLVTDGGAETVFKFYAYSTRRCYYTVNGSGEFFVLRDSVTKMLSDAVKVMNGETVDADAKY